MANNHSSAKTPLCMLSQVLMPPNSVFLLAHCLSKWKCLGKNPTQISRSPFMICLLKPNDNHHVKLPVDTGFVPAWWHTSRHIHKECDRFWKAQHIKLVQIKYRQIWLNNNGLDPCQLCHLVCFRKSLKECSLCETLCRQMDSGAASLIYSVTWRAAAHIGERNDESANKGW